MSEGEHSLTIKAWDNFNNSSEKTIIFQVLKGIGRFVIKNLINYPNPFSAMRQISLLEHNRPENVLDITLNIFNIDGRIIRIIKTKAEPSGYTLSPLNWDGNDEGGRRVSRGIYPYTVTLVTKNGDIARATGRMIIL